MKKKDCILLLIVIFVVSFVQPLNSATFFFNRDFNKNDLNLIKFSLLSYDWFFCEVGADEKYKAYLPGTVQTDLFKNGVIEDPYFRKNESKYSWIGEKDWEYWTYFDVNEKILEQENIELVFEGLDTYADVFLNDKLILRANNFFRKWSVDIKSLIRSGKNYLKIIFHSPLKIIKEKKEKYPYHKTTADYIFVRKPAYHFGWDWAPVYITMGVWKPVYIEAWSDVKLDGVRVIQKKVSKENADLEFILELISTGEREVKIELFQEDKKVKEVKRIKLKRGKNTETVELEIENPKLWWPLGMGKPHLYHFNVKIYTGKRVKGEWDDYIGIRKVELVREKDRLGESFYFKVNGIPVFIKGANYIPQDMFIPSVSEKRYETLFKNIIKSNINMLRVWGGGFYENDIFYRLCDKYGIMIWQDFMFACAMYPADREFLENVKEEAIYNIKRLRNHPSLVLWCGNNEVYEGWNHWGWQNMYNQEQRIKIENDYSKLFKELLPELVKKYDGERTYIHTSPLTNWGEPDLNTSGDVHYWGVWHGKEPFEIFNKKNKIGRFISEFGFQGLPDMKTIKEFTLPEDRKLYSKILRAHEKHPIGFEIIDKYMNDYFGKPVILEDYIYVSQLLQAYGIGMSIEAQRRAKPSCMGSLYWQLNDCWPVVSWSGIDWKGRWKALQYEVKKLYSDILVSPFQDKKFVNVQIISDKLKGVKGVLSLELLDFYGKVLWENKLSVFIPPNSNNTYFKIQKRQLLKMKDKKSVFLYITLFDTNRELVSERYYYFVRPKELNLLHPIVKIKIWKIKDGYHIELISDRLAKNLFLSFDNYEGFFTDNFFDLIPNKRKRIKFITTHKIKDPIASLKIMVYE